ncbi:MAG: S41 family peptidase [Vicinamibacterales bacterium]
MSARTRLLVLLVSAPLIVFVMLGGLLDRVFASEETYRHLRLFSDVISLVTANYVEEVDIDKVMNGAMRGLAEGAGADTAYLTPDQVALFLKGSQARGDIGAVLTRQYYLRVVAVGDGTPAARAGLRTGDYLRTIDGKPTREMSAVEGERALRGEPGTKVSLAVIRGNAAEPHEVDIQREVIPPAHVTSRMAGGGIGYVRIPAFGPSTAEQVKSSVAALKGTGANRLVIDVRSSATGSYENAIEVARLFVSKGTLSVLEAKGLEKRTFQAAAGDGAIALPAVVLVDAGTSGPGEVFSAALSGNGRAPLIGERTQGRVTLQKLETLPDGSGLLISYAWHLAPSGDAIHEKGLVPEVEVEAPDVEFGAPRPSTDPVLQKALERLGGQAGK